MTLRKLYNPEKGAMRIAGFISGSGSNLIKIIEHGRRVEEERGKAVYRVVVIFSDNPNSNAEKIGKDYDIPVIIRDLSVFYKERGKPRRDLSVRAEFDEGTRKELLSFNIDAIAYAGYMAIVTKPLIESFLGINVHPADLSILSGGKRKYTGDNAVRDAILAGEKEIRATTHILEEKVDYGRILMISSSLNVIVPSGFNLEDAEEVKKISSENQTRLKENGDWIVFPKTLEYIAEGKFSEDENGTLNFDEKPIPFGLRL
jgi:folate-dependent phosphoribosylglycinamide formyltransferase PurN